jgi:hypothetical protein
MNKPETRVMVDNAKYVRADSVKTEPVDESKEPLRIIMNDDRGLCLVGNVDLSGDGWLCEIKNARCIIRWGTKEHLAELAEKGPMDNTNLGFQKTQCIPRAKITLVIDCNEENWR